MAILPVPLAYELPIPAATVLRSFQQVTEPTTPHRILWIGHHPERRYWSTTEDWTITIWHKFYRREEPYPMTMTILHLTTTATGCHLELSFAYLGLVKAWAIGTGVLFLLILVLEMLTFGWGTRVCVCPPNSLHTIGGVILTAVIAGVVVIHNIQAARSDHQRLYLFVQGALVHLLP